MQKIILFISILVLFRCSGKRQANSIEANSEKIYYSDKANPYAKMQFPVEVSWNHDRNIREGDLMNLKLEVKPLVKLENVKIQLSIPSGVKISAGEAEKTIVMFSPGDLASMDLYLNPGVAGHYIVSLQIVGELNGEKMGTSRSIEFSTSGFEKPKSSSSKIGNQNYEVLEGRTDNNSR